MLLHFSALGLSGDSLQLALSLLFVLTAVCALHFRLFLQLEAFAAHLLFPMDPLKLAYFGFGLKLCLFMAFGAQARQAFLLRILMDVRTVRHHGVALIQWSVNHLGFKVRISLGLFFFIQVA